jgi:hypothetical protein
VGAVDALDARAEMRDALAQIKEAWSGADVPEGTRELLRQRDLDKQSEPGEAAGRAAHSDWREALREELEHCREMPARQAVEVLTMDGLITLMQAAVLGPPGPAVLLSQMAPGEGPALEDLARASLRLARAKAAHDALAPFARALEEMDVPVSKTLAASLEALNAILIDGDAASGIREGEVAE